MRIENEQKEKFEVLFDGYKQLSEQLNRLEERVTKQKEFNLRKVK